MQATPVLLLAMLSQHTRVWGALQDGVVVAVVGRVDAPMAMARTLMMVLACILVGGGLVGRLVGLGGGLGLRG